MNEQVLDAPRYELKEVIGSGTWGDVYSAKDTALDQEVAIKVLNPTPTARKQMLERNLTPFEAMSKEGGLSACSYVVPRSFELDGNGKYYIEGHGESTILVMQNGYSVFKISNSQFCKITNIKIDASGENGITPAIFVNEVENFLNDHIDNYDPSKVIIIEVLDKDE